MFFASSSCLGCMILIQIILLMSHSGNVCLTGGLDVEGCFESLKFIPGKGGITLASNIPPATLQRVAQLSSASLPPSVKAQGITACHFSLRCVEKQRDWSSVEVLYESELYAFVVSIWKDGLLACMPQAFQDLLGQVCVFPPWVMPRVFVTELLGPARNLLSPSTEVKGGHTLRKVERLLVESHSEHFSLKT